MKNNSHKNCFIRNTEYYLLSLLIIAGFTGNNPAMARHPNILLVMADDQGFGDVHLHGNPEIDTPVMDNLAGEGAWFERFLVSPVCAPTRASLLTGRDHLRAGTHWVTRGLESLHHDEITLGHIFKDAGYATALFGKWHNGYHYPSDPNGMGFDLFLGFKGGVWLNYFDTRLEYNGKFIETEGYMVDVLTDSTLSFIERNSDRPFFAYVPYNTPHTPFQVPDYYFDKYKARGHDDVKATIYGMIENIDDNLGRLLDKLEETGLTENTIVIYMSDNGPNTDRYNAYMRGRKASVDEGGVRVPFIMRWPGVIEPGTVVRKLAAHIDILPTLVELTGIPKPDTKPLDGRSFAPLVLGNVTEWPDRMLFTHHHQRQFDSIELFPASVRTNRYRLVNRGYEWHLYDMLLDPFQKVDISGTHPELADSLSGAYKNWFAEVTKDLPDARSVPVGYSEAPYVSLIATESRFDGNIRYFGGSGWANDWLTGWSYKEDRIWWDLDVINAGRHEVIMEYTLSEENVGSVIRVTAGDELLESEIRHPHKADFIPSQDRIPRTQVYEKASWGKFSLGELNLNEGRITLEVSASHVAGDYVLELKSIRLLSVNR